MTDSAGAVAILGLWLAGSSPGADGHVLAGARLFRENRFAEALVEFRVAEKLGSDEARSYAAAALVKLGEAEEALELFEAPREVPAGSDALLDYYHALACYDARLYLCADALLARVGANTGPRVGGHASRIRGDIAAMLAKEPPRDAVDWYLERSDARARAGRAGLASAFAREARALGARRSDRYGMAEAEARLSPGGAASAERPPATTPDRR
jgi:tetratricopeptide (TPR) repeat protein